MSKEVEHLANRYYYLLLGLMALLLSLVFLSYHNTSWIFEMIIVGYCTITMGVVYNAYKENDYLCFGKSEKGKIALCGIISLLPYVLALRIRHHLITCFGKENKFDKLADGVYIGSRPLNIRDLPEECNTVVDLAAEFSEIKDITESRHISYVSFPILEASVRSKEDIKNCINNLPNTSLYIHCAQGHGRTGFFSVAFLLEKGISKSLDEAIERISSSRPKAKIRKGQLAWLKTNY